MYIAKLTNNNTGLTWYTACYEFPNGAMAWGYGGNHYSAIVSLVKNISIIRELQKSF